MNPVTKIGGNLADLLSPVLGKGSLSSPSASVAQSDNLKAALLKAIQDGGTSSTKAASTDSNTIFGGANSELGKDSFLRLLVLQMQNQDPLEPEGQPLVDRTADALSDVSDGLFRPAPQFLRRLLVQRHARLLRRL